jgi:hypothetical protein
VSNVLDELEVVTPRVSSVSREKLEQALFVEPGRRVSAESAVAAPSPLRGTLT